MKYSKEISADAKEIGAHFDENIFVFFKILLPVVPFLLFYRLEHFVVPADLQMFTGPVLKFLQYWAGCAIAYHWMVYCLKGDVPRSFLHVLTGNAKFWLFFSIVVLFRVFIDLDKIIFAALGDNHDFIGNFNTLRYGILAVYVGIIYLVFRFSFVLPMLAEGRGAEWQTSWAATAKDAYQIILSGLRAALPYLIAVALMPNVARTVVGLIFSPGKKKIAMAFYMVMYLPVELLLVPILFALGASTAAYHYRERIILPQS